MITVVSFIFQLALISLGGWCIARMLLQANEDRALRIALALPLGTITNVFIVFMLTILSIPIQTLSIDIGHAGVIVILMWKIQRRPQPRSEETVDVSAQIRIPLRRTFITLCTIILASTAIYSFANSVLLPTFQYDSATNWTMRSKIAFYERAIPFEDTGDGAIRKPHYPILVHALQVTVNQGRSNWSDRAANTSLWLLSVTTLTALFLILSRMRGRLVALIATTLIVSTPLFAIHLGQGYADIVLAQFALLSLACLAIALETGSRPWLVLSAILVSACVWTKAEGLFFALIPWILLLAFLMWKNHIKTTLTLGIGLSAPWPIFAIIKGLGLTPHGGTDLSIAWHPEGMAALVNALFIKGSFGILWYVLPLMIAIVLFFRRKSCIDRTTVPTILWSGIIFLEILAIYLFTPNVEYLINGQSFDRQMLMPVSLLILSCIFLVSDAAINQSSVPQTRRNSPLQGPFPYLESSTPRIHAAKRA